MAKTQTTVSGLVVAIIACFAIIYLMRYFDDESVYLRAHPNCVLTQEKEQAESSMCGKLIKPMNERTYQCGTETKMFISCY